MWLYFFPVILKILNKEDFKDGNVEINIKRFASGLYYVKVQVENQSINKRFVKQ